MNSETSSVKYSAPDSDSKITKKKKKSVAFQKPAKLTVTENVPNTQPLSTKNPTIDLLEDLQKAGVLTDNKTRAIYKIFNGHSIAALKSHKNRKRHRAIVGIRPARKKSWLHIGKVWKVNRDPAVSSTATRSVIEPAVR